MQDPILIVGHGRSGTNWLLRLLDLSSDTHCRNEPNEIIGGSFAHLPCPWVAREKQPELEASWDEAVQPASLCMGERDPPLAVRKRHTHALSYWLGLHRIICRARVRRAAGLLTPSLRSWEWQLPRWLGSRRALKNAVPVLKLVQVPGWAAWVLANRPRTRVLHIVRHPGGFLNSWSKRYLARRDRAEVAQVNRHRLRMVVEADPSWAPRFGDIDRMPVEESELWYWLYACKTIDEAGARSPMYELIIYEELAADPVGVARRLFDVCGLSWLTRTENAIRMDSSNPQLIARAWRDSLAREHANLAARILKAEYTRRWWP